MLPSFSRDVAAQQLERKLTQLSIPPHRTPGTACHRGSPDRAWLCCCRSFSQRCGTEVQEFAAEIGHGKDKAVFSQAKVCVCQRPPGTKIALFPLPSTPGFDISAQHSPSTLIRGISSQETTPTTGEAPKRRVVGRTAFAFRNPSPLTFP